MLSTNSTLVQLDNRPIQTSTPNATQMTVIKTSQSGASKRSYGATHHTPAAKNPNRNKKVKDLILDLRAQQQQQQQVQNQQNQQLEQQQQQQTQIQQIQQQYHQQQQQQQQQSPAQPQFQPPIFQQQSQQSLYTESASPQFQLSDQTNTAHAYSNGQFAGSNSSASANQYLINESNSDDYLVSNNSKLITLNRLNNESESMHLVATNSADLNGLNQLDLMSLQSQGQLHPAQQNQHSLNQQQDQEQQAFDSYILENHGHTAHMDHQSLGNNLSHSQQHHLIHSHNPNHNHNQQQQHQHNLQQLDLQHQQSALDCNGSANGFGQFDAYSQQQMISGLTENGVDNEANSEEYMIFNLLNKIANGTNGDKLMEDEHLFNEKVAVKQQVIKSENCLENPEQPSYATLTSIVTSAAAGKPAPMANGLTHHQHNQHNQQQQHISPNSTASSSCSPLSSSPPSSASTSSSSLANTLQHHKQQQQQQQLQQQSQRPPQHQQQQQLFQLANVKQEKLDDFLPALSSLTTGNSKQPESLYNIQLADSEQASSSSSCSSSSSAGSNMMLILNGHNSINGSINSFNSINNLNGMNNTGNRSTASMIEAINMNTLNGGNCVLDLSHNQSHNQSQSQSQSQPTNAVPLQYGGVGEAQVELLQPSQECRVEIASPTNAQMEEINTKDLAHRVSSELKRYSIPQAVFAQRVLCRSQGTLSDLLRNPKPWSKLKSGRETFRRMYKWLQEPESQRMNNLRLAAANKRKEEDDDCDVSGVGSNGNCGGGAGLDDSVGEQAERGDRSQDREYPVSCSGAAAEGPEETANEAAPIQQQQTAVLANGATSGGIPMALAAAAEAGMGASEGSERCQGEAPGDESEGSVEGDDEAEGDEEENESESGSEADNSNGCSESDSENRGQLWQHGGQQHQQGANDSFSNYELYSQCPSLQQQPQQLLPSASTLLSMNSNDSQPLADLHQFGQAGLDPHFSQHMQHQQSQQGQLHHMQDYVCSGSGSVTSSGSQPSAKRPRLVFTDIQRRTLQAIFKETKRPSKEMQVTIAQQLGLEVTTVSNFFMNARRRSMDKWKDQCDDDDNSNCSSLTK